MDAIELKKTKQLPPILAAAMSGCYSPAVLVPPIAPTNPEDIQAVQQSSTSSHPPLRKLHRKAGSGGETIRNENHQDNDFISF